MSKYVDLFAGAGGWSLAAQRMGLEGVGLELNPDACKTRKAAGFKTFEGDLRSRAGFHTTEQGLIASPPCQGFSLIGNGNARAEMDKVLDCIRNWRWEGDFADPGSALILEPLRWIMNRAASERHFQWIAMEQVPSCLPIWQAYAAVLAEIGYWTAVGILDSSHYGVPQTRRRAVLMAHRDRDVFLPIPTVPLNQPVGFAEALDLSGDWTLVSNNVHGGSKLRGVRHSPAPSFTLTGRCNRMYLLPGFHERQRSTRGLGGRALTIPECGVLQSFPHHFPWQGETQSVVQQIGNAIPPLMAQAILEALIDV